MELLRHELYKIFSRKYLYLAALFFIVVGGAYLTLNGAYFTQYGDLGGLSSYYKSCAGPVTEKTRALSQQYQDRHDIQYGGGLNLLSEDVQNVSANAVSRKRLLAQLSDTIRTLSAKGEGNAYAARDAALQATMLKRLGTPGVYFTLPWQPILQFPQIDGFAFIAALILLGIAPLFSEEYATGVDELILCSKHGKRKIVTAKVAACVIFCVATALFFLLLDLLAVAVRAGSLGLALSSPIQSMAPFYNSPYALTIGGYFLLQVLTCTLGAVFLGFFVMLISSLSKNVLIPFAVCGFWFALTYFIAFLSPATLPTWVKNIGYLSYSELMRVNNLFNQYKTFDLFSQTVLYPVLLFVLAGIVSILFVCLSYRIFRKRQIG